jgi:two-component system, NarL family, sensor histidine kinase LiaS
VRLRECAPQLLDRSPGVRFFTVDGQRWGEVIQPTVTGQRAIVQYGTGPGPTIVLGALTISGTLPFLFIVVGFVLVFAMPLALAVAWFWARPLTRRISQIAAVSQQFAAGDFAARVHDRRQDEVGMLAQQFDDMADTLTLDVGVLRDLAERNAELARQVEQSAIQAERMRLSRDLHDDIAQHLFSLTIRAATLPDLIDRDPGRSKAQAQEFAAQAEQALLSLRTILTELRPSALLVRAFPEALQALCNDWQASEHIAVQYSAVLRGRRLPATVEDVVYRTVQEALHNVAKHAHATSVAVSLVEGQRQITLSITDDGQGFDPAQVANVGHLGIVSMRERARAIGGNLSIESDRGCGATVRLMLPIESESESTHDNSRVNC